MKIDKDLIKEVSQELNLPVREVSNIITLQNKVIRESMDNDEEVIRLMYIGKFIKNGKKKNIKSKD